MEVFESFLNKYQLKESHIYLLELIPLIEMIWADGRCQDGEIRILYQSTLDHLSRISQGSEDLELISDDDINEFLNRFTSSRPDPEMLRDLRQLCLERIDNKATEELRQQSKQTILDYCLDIAAASVKHYPYKFNERIIAEEKKLLQELFTALS